jgi:ADP-ribose pyrophosphatase YjhB (NUDIX family)
MDPKWLEWAKRLQAEGQNGLAYAVDPFDRVRYQAVCSIAAEMLADHTEVDTAHIRGLFDLEDGHATPKVDVRAVVICENALLLVRERSDGLWSLPGGWADVYESPSEAALREVREESGYEVRATRVLAVYDRDRQGHPPHRYHVYKVIFSCEIVGGLAEYSVETDGVDFFKEDALPDLSAGRVTRRQVARFFELFRNPEWPTDFD